MKQKERKKLNKRYYFNCIGHYDNCSSNSCWGINSYVNRTKWNINTTTKSRRTD